MLRQIQELADRTAQSFARLGAAIVRPIERLVGGVTGKVLSATDQVDRVESVLFRVVRVLTWPLRLVGGLFKLILPEALTSLLSNAWHSLQDLLGRIGSGLLHVAGILNLDRLVLGLVWLTRPIWRPLESLGVFFVSWVNTREYRRALMAIPAIFLATLVLGVGTWHALFGKSQVRKTYREANQQALDARDYELSELYDRKLADLGEDTQRTSYRTAETLAAEGKLDEAYERMLILAPEDRPGYPNAHFWIIRNLIGGRLGAAPDEAQRLAKVHLEHLDTVGIEAPFVTLLKAIWLARDNKLEEAADLLEPIVPQMQSAAMERMRINLRLKRSGQARQDARALVTHMKTRTRRDEQLAESDYQSWLAAEDLLGNLTQMRVILEMWASADPDSEPARKALAKVYRRQAANMLRDPLPDEKAIVELWLKAAKLDDSPDGLLRLSRALYKQRNSTPVYARILSALHESPSTPASLLIAVGTEAAQLGQYEEARPFFAAALSKDANNPIAWNNYGLVLGEGSEIDLDKALDAVNKAVSIVPNEHRFRETRGQILLKLERWQEAIADLEFAINGLPNLPEIHRSLAIAYQALGEDELARLHNEQLD
ncbi:MAG: hypothetical protein AAGD11_00745 [Planctomycetota bacterium]